MMNLDDTVPALPADEDIAASRPPEALPAAPEGGAGVVLVSAILAALMKRHPGGRLRVPLWVLSTLDARDQVSHEVVGESLVLKYKRLPKAPDHV